MPRGEANRDGFQSSQRCRSVDNCQTRPERFGNEARLEIGWCLVAPIDDREKRVDNIVGRVDCAEGFRTKAGGTVAPRFRLQINLLERKSHCLPDFVFVQELDPYNIHLNATLTSLVDFTSGFGDRLASISKFDAGTRMK